MKLYLAKPDLTYYEQFVDMMNEWRESGTLIAPWFLSRSADSLDEFASLVRMLDDCKHGILDKRYAASTSYFVIDETGRLVGAASLRHYLTVEGLQAWGHIGYGVRPSDRRKGYATRILRLTLEQAREKMIYRVLVSAYESNAGSRKVIENCGGVLENTVSVEGENDPICRYWIDVSKE